MTTPMRLRKATIADARAIAEVHIAAWRAAYSESMPSSFLEKLDVGERSLMWRNVLSKEGPGITVVCELEGEIRGFSVFGPSRDLDADKNSTCELVAINVHPQYWRRRCGQEMCHHVLLECSAQGYRSITLWVIKGNVVARRFYEKMGFYCEGTGKSDSSLTGSPIYEIRYRKELGQLP